MVENEESLDIAYALKTLREKKGMTQGDIWRATGLERPYVSRIEAGRVSSPNNNSAVFWINRPQFADAASIKTHDDPDRTKYTLDRVMPFPTSMQYTSGAISQYTPMSISFFVLFSLLIYFTVNCNVEP